MNCLQNSRYDSIIIWGHGLQYKDDILDMVRETDGFEIVRIVKHKPKNMKRFVNQVYSYDYAPLAHLKSKIKYLQSVEPCLLCVIVKNKLPDIDILGEGKFRHRESLKLKQLKTEIRERFNPYENGVMTHDHVIHATDNEEQTFHILRAIGDIDISKYYTKNLYSLPFFLGKQDKYSIVELDFEQLLCGQASGDSDSFAITHFPIEDSVQYKALSDGSEAYKQYVSKYLGTALKSDYNVDKFLSLTDDFKYLSTGFENSYVTVRQIKENKYLIVDGLHRASIHLFQSNSTIRVCLIK